MVKGLEKHQKRLQAITFLGKDLARRAKQRCELCGEKNEPRPWETEKSAEPTLENLVLLCVRCRDFAEGKIPDERTVRFLEEAVWNEHPQIATLAKTLLAQVDTDWARRTLEMVS